MYIIIVKTIMITTMVIMRMGMMIIMMMMITCYPNESHRLSPTLPRVPAAQGTCCRCLADEWRREPGAFGCAVKDLHLCLYP